MQVKDKLLFLKNNTIFQVLELMTRQSEWVIMVLNIHLRVGARVDKNFALVQVNMTLKQSLWETNLLHSISDLILKMKL